MDSVTTKLFKIVVLMLSAVDPVLLHRFFTGILVLSGPGGGKTSCVGRTLALALLRNVPQLGGLILTAKFEETQNWISYLKVAGREKDLILFNASSGEFNPFDYEWNCQGRGRKSVEGIVELFTTLASLNKRDSGQGEGSFWIRGTELMIRGAVVILDLAGEVISIVNIDKVIKSLPTRPGEHEEAEYQRSSYCAQLIESIRNRRGSLSEDEWDDLAVAVDALFVQWPATDERPRSSLAMTWSGMCNRFLYSPLNKAFNRSCSFSPEDTYAGKFVLVDWPMLEIGQATGQFINVCLKLVFLRAWLRRDLSKYPNPVLIWQDEYQYFLTDRDNFYSETSRGARVATVALSQNILGLSESLGEPQPGSKTKSLLGNFATKILLQQNETVTNEYAADQIGKRWKFVENFSGGSEGGSTFGGSLQLTHIVEPSEFSRLTPPGPDNPLAESICYQSGKTFNATRTEQNPEGEPYLRVSFSRND